MDEADEPPGEGLDSGDEAEVVDGVAWKVGVITADCNSACNRITTVRIYLWIPERMGAIRMQLDHCIRTYWYVRNRTVSNQKVTNFFRIYRLPSTIIHNKPDRPTSQEYRST